MKTFEYSPFNDVYAPYIVSPNLYRRPEFSRIWEAMRGTRLPTLTRWVIYNALRQM